MGIAEKIISGDIRAAARLIRDIDDMIPEARAVLKRLYPHTGTAHVVGVTGASGVGKSTLVDQMVGHLRGAGRTAGILAVDPTSRFSGGALLGDRIRMQRHSADEGVFIRSMATRGSMGGLTQSTRGVIDVLDAMGKDYIFVETVGAGQDEIDIVKTAHTTIIVLIPGMGDDIQTLKAGILEVGDIFVINKADREGTDRTLIDIRSMIDMDEKRYRDGWKPPVLTAQAAYGKGIDEIINEVERHRTYFTSSRERQSRQRHERARNGLAELIRHKILHEVLDDIVGSGEFEEALHLIMEGKMDPYTACDEIVLKRLTRGKR